MASVLMDVQHVNVTQRELSMLIRFVIQLKVNVSVSPVLAVATVANVCLDTGDSLIVKSVSVMATQMCAIRNQANVLTVLTIQKANILMNVPMATTVMQGSSLVNPFHVILVHAQKDPALVVNLLPHVT